MTKEEKAKARAQAKADFLEGMSYREIAANYGVGLGSVARWAEKDGWDLSKRNTNGTHARNRGTKAEQAIDEETVAQALQAIEEDVPVEEPEKYADFDLLRETALMVLQKIRQRLEAEKPLEPRDIKSLTGALLDLKNQLNALSPRELREQALRLQALRRQAEDESKPAEPVVVKFVNREWDDAGA